MTYLGIATFSIHSLSSQVEKILKFIREIESIQRDLKIQHRDVLASSSVLNTEKLRSKVQSLIQLSCINSEYIYSIYIYESLCLFEYFEELRNLHFRLS